MSDNKNNSFWDEASSKYITVLREALPGLAGRPLSELFPYGSLQYYTDGCDLNTRQQREELRDAIVKHALKDVQTVNSPQFVMVHGLPGSGKTTLTSAIVKALGKMDQITRSGGLFIDAADFYTELPEHAFFKQNFPEGIMFLTREAWNMAEKAANKIIEANADFIYEWTNSWKNPSEMMRAAKSKGYKNIFISFIADPEISESRARARSLINGHRQEKLQIPKTFLEQTVPHIKNSFIDAVQEADQVILVDNTRERYDAKIIAIKTPTTKELIVFDKDKFDSYLIGHSVPAYRAPTDVELTTKKQLEEAINTRSVAHGSENIPSSLTP